MSIFGLKALLKNRRVAPPNYCGQWPKTPFPGPGQKIAGVQHYLVACDQICNRCEGSTGEITCFVDCVHPGCELLRLKCKSNGPNQSQCQHFGQCAMQTANEQPIAEPSKPVSVKLNPEEGK